MRTKSPYSRGRKFEYEVKKTLQSHSWFVARHAQSALPDLVAAKRGRLLLVECKINRISRGEKARMLAYADESGGIPLLATHSPSGISWFLITQGLGLRRFDLQEFGI